jgi:hypothetical protein
LAQHDTRLPAQSPKVAFLILAHDDMAMLRRLCARLAPHDVYIHLDARSQVEASEVKTLGPNVRFSEVRIAAHWADFSLVEAAQTLLELALRSGNYSHFVLLSGHCYPIKPVDEFLGLLREHPDRNFLQLVPIAKGSFLYGRLGRHWRTRPFIAAAASSKRSVLVRLDQLLVRTWNRFSRAIPRDFMREISPWVPYYGSQWWALTRSAAEKVVGGAAAHAAHRAFRSTFAPDETCMQTVLGNLLEPNAIIGPNQDRGPASVLDAPLHLVADSDGRWLADTPDQRLAIERSDKFFVRKVTSAQAELLDWIDAAQLKA